MYRNDLSNKRARSTDISTMTLPKQITSREDVETLLDSYDSFMFDCDGVIWLGEDLIPGIRETLEFLKLRGKKFVFVTNNSSQSRSDYVRKFERLGIKDVSKESIFPTSYVAARVLKLEFKVPEGSKIWAFGESGIEQELKEAGYVPMGGTDPSLSEPFNPRHPLLHQKGIKGVVVGSTKETSYLRIASTLQYLLGSSAPFLGTNVDRTYPGPSGLTLPAGGCNVFMMHYVSQREFVNVGKPEQTFLNFILEATGYDRKRTLMVGDTLYTDVQFGNIGKLGGPRGGSLLVLSGGSSLEDLRKVLLAQDRELTPHYYMGLLAEVARLGGPGQPAHRDLHSHES